MRANVSTLVASGEQRDPRNWREASQCGLTLWIPGIKIAVSDSLAALIDGAYRYQFPTAAHHGFHYGSGLRWGVATDLALDLTYRRFPRDWEASAGLYYYF